MKKLFQHSAENPFHISVGAVLVNQQGQILVHRAAKELLPQDMQVALPNVLEAYILMRESLENEETLEEAVLRGLQEEFGATGQIQKYLGSIQCMVGSTHGQVEKTTLYFLVSLIEQGMRPPEDEEAFTELVWIEPMELLECMRAQNSDIRGDLDESKIIQTYLKYP